MVTATRSLLNFALVGECRSGAGVVCDSINNRHGVVCHRNLFHANNDVRKEAHETYFGQSLDSCRTPSHFVDGETHPHQYLNCTVFDRALRNEIAVGVHLPYEIVRRWELFELFEERCRAGEFAVIHVVRNPVACFISMKQAEKTGAWTRPLNDSKGGPIPSAIRLDPDELTEFCRAYVSLHGKIRAACDSHFDEHLEITYIDLFENYQATMQKVFWFLNLKSSSQPARAATLRLKNRPIRERVSNLSILRLEVPNDVRALLDADDLF